MNQYLAQKLPGSLSCFVGEDIYTKTMEVKDFAFKALSDQAFAALDTTPVITLTVPATAKFAKVTNTGANEFYYTVSGTTPAVATGVGVPVGVDQSIILYGAAMAAFRAVALDASVTNVYVQYFAE